MSTATLLVELFTEELPPKALKRLGEAFADGIVGGLEKRGFLDHGFVREIYATPRRLAVRVSNVRDMAADEAFTEKLMPVAVGLDKDGKATPALVKKLAAKSLAHLPVSELLQESDGKALQLLYRGIAKGQVLQFGLQKALEEAINGLPIPKLMSYQLNDGVTTVQFVRPAHGLVALHGKTIVPVTALGLNAGGTTHGHRFQGAKDILLKNANEYPQRLETEGGVVASFDKRRAEIMHLLASAAEEVGDTLGEPWHYAALLDEVCALVERPTVYVGKFDAEFLEVPTECLVLTMKLNQKYFPLYLPAGGLSSRFLIVSNMRLLDPQNVILGNERVVRPRLSDARFFFETDKKTRLEDRTRKLAAVVYHNKLGSQGERVARVGVLAASIATRINADAALATRAALLAKADLVSDMVGEFPELQGTMGRYYALHDGESPIVADAIAEHYLPRFAGDRLPGSGVALAVALADKLETLAGLFGIGQQPTGDKDPFALRRHALGVLRMLLEKQLAVPLTELVDSAFNAFPPGLLTDTRSTLVAFLFERLRGLLRETGYTANEIESVIAHLDAGVHIAPTLLEAVRAFTALPEALSLAAANKRISNILKKSTEQFANVDAALLVEPAEGALFAALQSARGVFLPLYEARNYTAALTSLARLKIPVDAFFDAVMVNAEDAKLRANRLALLSSLHGLMNRFVDISKLA